MGAIGDFFVDFASALFNPEEARRRHQSQMAMYERARAERDRAKDAGILTSEIENQLLEWGKRLGGDRANQGLKMIFDPANGWTNIYFGGINDPDGDGHGHIRVLTDGTQTIVREPFIKGAPNARRDATLVDDRTPDKRK